MKSEINLLSALAENVKDTNLLGNEHDAENQIKIITSYCNILGINVADMIRLGKNHSFDVNPNFITDLTTNFLLSFEDIVRRMLERTSMNEEDIDTLIDVICLDSIGYDTEYYLAVDESRICLGDNPFGGDDKSNLREHFSIFKMIDEDTEMENTDNGEYGFIKGVKYDLANISNEDENSLILSLLKTSAKELVGELNT